MRRARLLSHLSVLLTHLCQLELAQMARFVLWFLVAMRKYFLGLILTTMESHHPHPHLALRAHGHHLRLRHHR